MIGEGSSPYFLALHISYIIRVRAKVPRGRGVNVLVRGARKRRIVSRYLTYYMTDTIKFPSVCAIAFSPSQLYLVPIPIFACNIRDGSSSREVWSLQRHPKEGLFSHQILFFNIMIFIVFWLITVVQCLGFLKFVVLLVEKAANNQQKTCCYHNIQPSRKNANPNR